ncbi:MAG: ATP synthase F1 subunit epsilon [Clostridia bacterium]|nr:ATP synthase F1 subunit epsilon [Clostridia bacterium]MBQ8289716.1 ATP synthase F1 subunit epsilon [Clostridia bacterium]
MTPFKLTVMTPDGIAYEGEAVSIIATTDEGEVQILARHADYLAALGTGRVKLELPDGTVRTAASSGGFLTVQNGEVTLSAVTFEYKEDIDLERALRAEERAKKELSSAKDARDERLARARLNRAVSRIRIAREK